jgi:glycosyltransferase involved in cell wall biosynthesis
VRRILIVGDYPPPYGGVSVPVASLRHHLAARADTEVRVLDIGTRRTERRPGCLPVRGAADFARALLRHALDGFTIHLHTNGHNVKSWIVAALCVAAGLGTGRRTVIGFGSGAMASFVTTASPLVRALVRASVAGAGAVIVSHEVARKAVLARGAAPGKVVVLPWFYGVASEEIGELPSAAATFEATHRPLLGAMASLGPEYGLALLLDAAARLRPRHPRLGVLLMGPDPLPDGCPRWALPMGELHRPALLATLGALDVFVRPTYFDGDAVSVREALALGVRVVASDTDLRPAGARLFPRGDAEALAGAIEAALEAPAPRIDSTSLPALLDLYDRLPLGPARPASRAMTAPSVRPDAAGGARVG